MDYAYDIKKKLEAAGILRVEIDDRSEKLGFKLREAQLEKIPYMIVIGDKDTENGTVSVRSRKNGDMGAMPIDEFVAMIAKEQETKAR